MIGALITEFGKLKRSRMILWTVLIIVGYTSIGLAVFPALKDMMASAGSGPGGQAIADIFAEAGITKIDWPTAMRFIAMGVSGAWGIMLLSLIAAYVFGRERREGTDVSMATLPVRREWFVVAKLVVIAAWVIGLALLAVVVQVAVDAIYMGFDGFKLAYPLKALGETLYALLPLYLTVPLVGWIAMSRKGYLRPMLFALAMFMLASGMVGQEAAAYFPWSMPIAAVGVTWMPLAKGLTPVSWIIALAVFAIGLYGVMRAANRSTELA